MSGSHLSKDFFDLVKAIGESKSKQEEDRIISAEVKVLKQRFQEKNLSKKVIKESLVRLIYVEMLGHDASFAYVHAIQLTAAGDLVQKKTGYLCAALTLSPEHEFRFMLVNQLQRDLGSANILEVSTALIALSKLITSEMIPALLPFVEKLLTHEQSSIRKKAVLAIYRIYELDEGSIDHIIDSFRRVLCDKDPAVMGAALVMLYELAKANPQSQKDLVPSYVSILKQIVEHRLPKDFDYHRIPAPWIQIKLLKILAVLGQNDQRASEGMYEILHDCMKKANTGIYVGYAIIYECVQTVTTIYPNPVLLDAAAGAIARFIQSESHNLKYLGVTGLAAIVRDHPRYAAEHQMVVLDCLEDPDETLKRKTLDLLFRMTNPVNAEVVVDKLLYFLKDAVDKFLRQDLVTRICQLAERFAPNNIWYVRTIAKVFELGGDLVEAEVAHNLLRLLAEGVGEDESGETDEDPDDAMRREACEIFYDMFEKPLLPDILLRVMFWTLGEYAYLLGVETVPEVLEVICEAAARQGMSPSTRGYGVSSAMKMCAQIGRLSPEAADLIDKYSASLDADLQQKCYEFREIARNVATMQAVLPVDASCEDLSEPDFGFLDAFVQDALASGAPEYSPPSQEENELYEYDDDDLEQRAQQAKSEPALKYDAYEKPAPPSMNFTPEPALDYSSSATGGDSADADSGQNGASALKLGPGGINLKGVKTVWGAQGYALGNASTSQQSEPKQTTNNYGYDDGIPTVAAVPDTYSVPREPEPPVQQQQPTPPKAESPKPKELTERERMAAALFSGVVNDGLTSSSSNSTQSRSSGPRRPRNLSRNAAPAPAEKAPASPVNLLDFDDDHQASTHEENHVEVVSNAEMDLLSAFSEPSQPSAQEPQAASGLEDLLGGMSMEPSTPFSAVTLTTQDFGQQWLASPQEAKFSVNLAGVQSIQDVVSRIETALGVSVVEVIYQTEEAIFAGSHASGGSVLLHAKRRVAPTPGADLITRTNPGTLTSTVEQECRSRLA